MRLIEEDKFNKLYADEGKHIRAIDDVYKPAYTDENGNFTEAHFPNYFVEAYIPKKVKEDNMDRFYVEEENVRKG